MTFDLFARDRASGAFTKVGQAAEKTGRSVGGLSKSFGSITAGSRGLQTTFGMIGRGAALAAGAAGLGGLIVGFQGVYQEAREAQKVGAQTNAVIKSTGGAAKISAEQVGALASSISNKVGVDDEAIQSGANLLLTFVAVRNEAGKGNDIFNQATSTITDMAAAMNSGKVTSEGMKKASIQVGKALQDPIRGITALRKVGVSFTDQQRKQIETMVKSGDKLGAQKIILAELNKEFGGSAVAGTNAMQKLGVVFGNIKENIGSALLPIIDRLASWLASVLPGAIAGASRILTGFGRLISSTFEYGPIKAFQSGFRGLVYEDMSAADRIFARVGQAIAAVKNAFEYGPIKAFQSGFRSLIFEDMTAADRIFAQVGRAVRALTGFISEHRELLIAMSKGVVAVTGAFLAFKAVMAAVSLVMSINPIGAVIVGLGALAGATVYAYKHSERFRQIVQTVWQAVQNLGAFLVRTFTPAARAVGEVFTQRVLPALQNLWAVVQRNMSAIQAFAKFIGAVIVVVGALALKIAGFLLPILVRIAGFLLGKLFGLLAQTIQYFGNVVRAVQSMWTAFQRFLGIVSGVWRSFIAGTRVAIAAVVGTFLNMVGTILNGAAKAFGWVPGVGPKLRQAAGEFNKFRDSVNAALAGVKSRKITVSATLTAGPVGRSSYAAAKGWKIPGYGGGDIVPIMAEPGEAVIPKHHVPEIADWAKRKGIPGFQTGGVIGGLTVTPELRGRKAFGDSLDRFNRAVDGMARKLALTASGGPLGGGAVMGYQNQMAVLRRAFPGLALISGFRPGAITATGNRSYHSMGRAVDVPPRMDVFNWIRANYGARTKELIFSPAGNNQIWNGRPHWYSEPTRGDHWDHVHWAMANGGVIREPVLGVGRSGATYSFAEHGPETVTPGVGAGDVHVHFHGPVLGGAREVARELAPAIRSAIRSAQRREGLKATV